ncbi:hypothetical protein GCM10028807_57900 [Spirosoma daeguense]
MFLKAKERQTGVYGTVNKGDTIEVSDFLGQELIEIGTFEETSKPNDTATAEEVSEHNVSGLKQEPIHTDGTPREILNTDGRKLHETGPLAEAEASARIEAGETADLGDVPVSDGDEAATKTDKKKKS